jgi:cyanocobalamin reductase (cyanide-eliminating) / alkylcobalamin dealkylase
MATHPKRSILSWQEAMELLRQRLADTGIDLLQPFSIGWYNQGVDESLRLPDFGRSSSFGVLVANSRALWPAFLDAAAANAGLVRAPHPIDQYVQGQVLEAIDALSPCHWEVRWEYEEPPRRVAMQRLAEVIGFANLSPAHLCVHPKYGPWVSLRAVIVVDVEGPSEQPPPLKSSCPECATHCGALLEAALAASPHFESAESATVAANWRPWVSVREACSTGDCYRFYDDQIRYHYTKDRGVLEASLALLKASRT